MTKSYYDTWLSSYGEPLLEPYDEAEAGRRFEARTTVTALIGDGAPHAPDVVICIELGGDMVEVYWLDELQRPTLEYLWSREDDTPQGPRLHLQQVHLKTYDHARRLPEGQATHDETYYINTDGTYTAFRGPRGEPSERGTGSDPENVKWQALPAFGDWEPFLDPDR